MGASLGDSKSGAQIFLGRGVHTHAVSFYSCSVCLSCMVFCPNESSRWILITSCHMCKLVVTIAAGGKMDASLLSELVVQIFRANGALTAWGDRFAAESGLTTARWQVLGAISMAKEPSTSPQIAERMGITRQGVQKQLNLLRDEGLVMSVENPAHKRSPRYSLTEHGEQKLAEIRKRWRQQVKQWSGSYQHESVSAALEVLDVLSEQMKE